MALPKRIGMGKVRNLKLKTSLQELDRKDCEILKAGHLERQAKLPSIMLEMLQRLEPLYDEVRGVTQLHHALQTATMAYKANAADDLILGSLFHDIGKVFSQVNHAGVAAEIIRKYVSHETYEIIRTHDIFQGKHVNWFVGGDPDAREQFANEKWFNQAIIFTDDWDSRAFDVKYKVHEVEFFKPLIENLFAEPKKNKTAA